MDTDVEYIREFLASKSFYKKGEITDGEIYQVIAELTDQDRIVVSGRFTFFP